MEDLYFYLDFLLAIMIIARMIAIMTKIPLALPAIATTFNPSESVCPVVVVVLGGGKAAKCTNS